MRINTNVSALNTNRMLSQTNDSVARSIGRLSSGFRINRAADDAAGLAIANRFSADIRSLRVAQQNTTEAASMLQVAEGNATSISNILGRMKELATQASSYNAESQTGKLNDEFQALSREINRIVGSANYQGVALLDGSFDGTFQIGTTAGENDRLGIILSSGSSTAAIQDLLTVNDDLGQISWNSSALASLDQSAAASYNIVATDDGSGNFTGFALSDGTSNVATGTVGTDGSVELKTTANGFSFTVATFKVDPDFDNETFDVDAFNIDPTAVGTGGLSVEDLKLDEVNLATNDSAQVALSAIDSAIDTVSSFLGNIGATQNRLEYAAANIATTVENYSASESAIRDADMAFEMTTFTRNQIMQQAATAMLAQANMAPQNILRLLG